MTDKITIDRALLQQALKSAPPPEQQPLTDAILAEPTQMIHKWRVLELVKYYSASVQPGDQFQFRVQCEALGRELAALKAAYPADPVAWISVGGEWGAELLDWEIDPEQQLCDAINEKYVGNPQKLPLYTAPPEQQPLTKAQIKALIVATPEPDDGDVGKWVLSLIRAVEKAHKIGSRP